MGWVSILVRTGFGREAERKGWRVDFEIGLAVIHLTRPAGGLASLSEIAIADE